MTYTYVQPGVIPRWADTTGHITPPSSGKQDVGWLFQESPPSDIENWRTHWVGEWIKFIDDHFDGSSATQFDILDPDGDTVFRSTTTYTGVYAHNGRVYFGGPGFNIAYLEQSPGICTLMFDTVADMELVADLTIAEWSFKNSGVKLAALRPEWFQLFETPFPRYFDNTSANESLYYFSHLLADGYPTMSWRTGDNQVAIALERGSAGDIGAMGGNWSVDKDGIMWLRNPDDIDFGPSFRFRNAAFTNAARWDLDVYEVSGDGTFIISSRNSSDVLEKTYWELHPLSIMSITNAYTMMLGKDMVFCRYIWAGAGYLGHVDVAWTELHVEKVYEQDSAFASYKETSDLLIATTTWTPITPDDPIDNNNIAISSKVISVSSNGKYLINSMFVLRFKGTTWTNTYAATICLFRGATQLSDFDLTFNVPDYRLYEPIDVVIPYSICPQLDTAYDYTIQIYHNMPSPLPAAELTVKATSQISITTEHLDA